jgi:hypothetical protein
MRHSSGDAAARGSSKRSNFSIPTLTSGWKTEEILGFTFRRYPPPKKQVTGKMVPCITGSPSPDYHRQMSSTYYWLAVLGETSDFFKKKVYPL